MTGTHSVSHNSNRALRVIVGAVYVFVAVVGILIQAGGVGGVGGLVEMIVSDQQGAPETRAMAWVLVLSFIATVGVGTYLLAVRQPSRTGWYGSLLMMGLLAIVDLVVLSPQAPVRVPSFVGHAGLAVLLLALAGWKWSNRSASAVP